MNVQQIAARLMQDEVVAYPTEAVFGLGCNPLSESAVRKLLDLKQRPIEKGLILVAPSLHFLQPFVDHLAAAQMLCVPNLGQISLCLMKLSAKHKTHRKSAICSQTSYSDKDKICSTMPFGAIRLPKVNPR